MASPVSNVVKENVRAVLLSKTDGSGILVSQFLNDYKKIMHEQLLFRNMGFPHLEDFIKAIPDVCRLEYSNKDMAFKLFGIAKANMYVSSFVKKAEGSADGNSTDGPHRGRRGGGGNDKADRYMPSQDLSEAWVPNNMGLYSLCFPRHKDPSLNTSEAVVVKFSKIGEVVDVNMTKVLIFVRYSEEEFAKTAVRMYGASLGMKRAEERKGGPAADKSGRTYSKKPERNTNWGQGDSNVKVNGNYGDNVEDCHKKSNGFVKQQDAADGTKSFNGFVKQQDAADGPKSFNGFEKQQDAADGPKSFNGFMKQQDAADGPKSFNKPASLTSPGQQKSGGKVSQVYIGNWPYDGTEDDMKGLLHGYKHSRIRIKNSGQKVFAFVDMMSRKDAEQVIAMLDKTEFHGRHLQVRHGHTGTGGDGHHSGNTSMDSEMENLQLTSPTMKPVPQTPPKTSKPVFNVPQTPPKTSNPVFNVPKTSPKTSKPVFKPPAPVEPPEEEEMPPLEALQSPSMPCLEKQSLGYTDRDDDDDVMPSLEISYMPQERSVDRMEGLEAIQLFIGNFPYGTTEDQLFELFSPYDVLNITVMNQNITNRSTYAFATVGSVEQAQLAILSLDQSLFNGRRLTVAMANPSMMKPAPKTGFNQQLAKITCTVGGSRQVGRKVSMEAPSISSQWSDSSYGNSGDWLIQQLNSEEPHTPPHPPLPHRYHGNPPAGPHYNAPPPARYEGHHPAGPENHRSNYRLHNVFSDYMKIVSKLRGDDFMFMPIGTTARVMITHVENDKIFWAQLLENSQTGPNRSLESLEQITRDLQRPDVKTGKPDRMGRCGAMFQGEWYRAWCTHIGERDGRMIGDVMFIDYGNREILPCDEMCLLKAEMWRIPPMARPFKFVKPWAELQSMVEKVIVLEVLEPATSKVNYMTTTVLR